MGDMLGRELHRGDMILLNNLSHHDCNGKKSYIIVGMYINNCYADIYVSLLNSMRIVSKSICSCYILSGKDRDAAYKHFSIKGSVLDEGNRDEGCMVEYFGRPLQAGDFIAWMGENLGHMQYGIVTGSDTVYYISCVTGVFKEAHISTVLKIETMCEQERDKYKLLIKQYQQKSLEEFRRV